MKLSKFKIEHSFLRSRVALRIFFLFIICALLPISVMAYFSLNRVTKQLYHQTDNRLHQMSKSGGLAIVERLQFLETQFKIIIRNLQKGTSGSLESHIKEFQERANNRFMGLALVGDRGQMVSSLGSIQTFPALSMDEQQHIHDGKTLVKALPKTDRSTEIFIVRAINPEQPADGLLFGKIHPAYLWGEEFLSPQAKLSILDESKNVLFSTSIKHFPMQELEKSVGQSSASGRFTWTYEDNTYLAAYRTIFMTPQFFSKWILVHSQSEDDILEPLVSFKKIFKLVTILSFLVIMFLSLIQIRKSLVPIDLLREATRRIAVKDFGSPVKIKSNDEFKELGESLNEMADRLENHFRTMTAINQVGLALSAEQDTHRLMKIILNGAKAITHADGSALYALTEDQQLKLSIIHINSLHLSIYKPNQVSFPLHDNDGKPNKSTVATYSVLKDRTMNIHDIYATKGFDFSSQLNFDKKIGYRTKSCLSVPLKNHENEIIGVLQLFNAQDKHSHEIVTFSEEDQRIAETLASQTAVALAKNTLIEDFKRLFDSLTELIATAIDEKSPYTGAHCKRVPELTMMLANAVSKTKDGIFKDITFSEEALYELKISALLHDCGKVTTPVHIVDKATKLETIFNRIHLIDTRFEVLKRDIQITFLRKKLAAINSGNNLVEKEIQETMQQIDKDRDLLRACNSGVELMSQELQDRVKEIAHKYRWVNPKGEEEFILTENEVYNLTISKGTINPEERRLIENHITLTNKMLESLPYPKTLRNVPEFAGAHHEYMDGKGYPKGLTRDQIPLQGRIIAIADIFEALTASDRPYKKVKTLTEATRILDSMKQNGHIDPDLFDVFMKEKVYLRYAEKYLVSEQIEEID